ncbi:DUF4810 domain-containing protein [Solimonas marina]|uniref:DUF4810 domain-containing protein n=1 Tax=Solimonas marina TaxID=2714601 RepID=A0A970B603_9GAMM|nr:DUF4810 domain-containing protein [Solimonas marina]NKF22130.1 DUF4810 domain-containing protein [Solimonas marina]
MTALLRAGLAVAATLLLFGCAAQPKPLYYWGSYQPQLYAYFQGDGKSPEQQRTALEKTAAKANAKGEALPPGFHAHLGLLYLRMGQPAQARTAFLAEEAEFPESKPYMDFLIGNLNRSQASAP